MPKIIVREEVTRVVKVGGPAVPGPAGPGVPIGGSSGQILRKKSAGDTDTEWSNTAPVAANALALGGETAASLQGRLGAVETGQASAIIGRATQSDLLGVIPADEDAVGYVAADPDPSKNGNYYRSGGTWVQSPFDRVAQVEGRTAVLEDNMVELIPKKNLIDKSKIRRGYYVSPGASAIVASAAWRCSDFIPVVAGQIYVVSGLDNGMAVGFFSSKSDTAYLSSTTDIDASFVAPAGAAFMVVNITNDGQDVLTFDATAQAEVGPFVTAYEPYLAVIPTSKVQEGFVAESDLLETIIPNLFDPSAIDWTKRLSPSTGNVVSADTNPLAATGFIEVTEGAWYSFGGTATPTSDQVVGMFSDASSVTAVAKATLVPLASGWYKFQIPEGQNIRRIRLNVIATVATQTVTGEMQINLGESVNEYSAYTERTQVKEDRLPLSLSAYVQRTDIIEETSFNKIDPEKIDFIRRYSTGSKAILIDTIGLAATDYIPVEEGKWYTVSGAGIYALALGPTKCQGGYFATRGDLASIDNISFVAPVVAPGATFQVPIGLGINYVVISLQKLGGDPEETSLEGAVQMEKGEMATDYQAYDPQSKFLESLIPVASTPAASGSFDAEAWYKFTAGDEGQYLADKFPVFRRHWLTRDKDLVVVNTGTSLTARSDEHCTDHPDATIRPPLMHSRNMASHLWDRLAWDGQQYRRYDAEGFFTEAVGAFASATNLAEWDDGPYRAGYTRYAEDAGAAVSFVVPVDAWQFNFIFRTDTTGTDQVAVTVAEGNGKMEIYDEATESWVEANGYIFSMRESAPATRTISVPSPTTDTFSDLIIASKGNTTYQKRLKMRCKSALIDSRAGTKTITLTGQTAGRFMYWGVEWSPREYMLTYINAARGSHNTQATNSKGLPKFQDNEIWSFKPDLLFFELPIHNDGTDSATAFAANYWSRLTNNFVFRADYELALKTRGTYHGLSPEIGMFTSSISWNFGGIADDGTLKYNAQADGSMMSSLDKFNQAYLWVQENHPEAVIINAAKRWVDAALAIYGDLRSATEGSGKNGLTFTNEGSHWNDTGSKIIAKALTPVFDFTR